MSNQTEAEIIQQLSQAGYRVTQPRRAVIRALLQEPGHPSPAQVHVRARQECSHVGLVTVYRTLELLSELGCVRRIHTAKGCHGYALASHGHYHHIVCRLCGETVEFEGCDLGPLLAQVSEETGYTVEDHLLELIGLCSSCQ